MTLLGMVLVGLLLAFANGANDNFKGVATLHGSGTLTYRQALAWGTLATALGSISALLLAGKLLAAFSGKGLVPAAIVAAPAFTVAVGLAAAATVLLATRAGLPVSTTHALIGGLIGAGLATPHSHLALANLGQGFVLPLLLSPVLAALLTGLAYPWLRRARVRLGIDRQTCVCIGREVVHAVPGHLTPAQAAVLATEYRLRVDGEANCRLRYQGEFVGLPANRLLDAAHLLVGGAVSFARGLNDTPKIAALLLVGGWLSPAASLLPVAAAIALGGWFAARRVADTMAHRITSMNPGQGLTANLVTAGLVIGASHLGLPVSTTHVSCGALFGLGAVTRRANWQQVREILLAWLLTLPVAGVLAAGLAWSLARF